MQKQKLLILFDGKNELLDNVLVSVKNFYADSFDVKKIDVFEQPGLDKLKGKIGSPLDITSGQFYLRVKRSGGPRTMRFYTGLCLGGKVKKVIQLIKSESPDLVVSTNYFLAYCAVKFKRKINRNCRVITINPELVIHHWWDNKDNIFVVNNETAFYDAIGKRRFSPALVCKAEPYIPSDFCKMVEQKQMLRGEFKINENETCILFDKLNKKTLKILNNFSTISGDFCVFIFSERTPKQLLLQKLVRHQNKNVKLKFVGSEKDKLKYQCAADIFVTSDNYSQIKNSLLFEVPILLYSKCKKFNPIRRFFVDETEAGVYVTKPKKIAEQLQTFISSPEVLTTLKQNASKICNLSSSTDSIAKVIFDTSNIPIVNVDKKPYNNMLYELALQEKFDTFTTPINIASVKDMVAYDKFKRKNILSKTNNVFVLTLLKGLAPIVNFLGFRLKVVGKKNLKNIDSAITISNHVHYLDCLWNFQTLTKKKRLYFTGASFNFKKGFLGAFLKTCGFIPIATTFSQKKEFDKFVSELLEKKCFVHFYPEQAMWLKYPQSRPLKKGAFLYASKNEVPVIPLVICFKKAFTFSGFAVTIKICDPIFPDKSLSQTENCTRMNRLAQEEYDKAIIDFYGYDAETYAQNKVQVSKFQKK